MNWKYLVTTPLLGLLALTVPQGCAMDMESDAGQQADQTESPAGEESNAESLAASGKWRLFDAVYCPDYCSTNSCSCVTPARCPTSTPQGRVCPTVGKQCVVIYGNTRASYYECRPN